MLSGWFISPCDESTKVLLLFDRDCDESVPRSVNRLLFFKDSKTLFFHLCMYKKKTAFSLSLTHFSAVLRSTV